jgi:hypothetical protein
LSAGAAAKRTSWRRISLLEDDLAELEASSGATALRAQHRPGVAPPAPGSPAAFRAAIANHQEDAVTSNGRLIWEDPPPRIRGGSTEPPDWLAELKAHPGKWAIVIARAKSNSTAASLRKRWGIEVTARGNKADGWKIYARVPVPTRT